jgi:hypothetical protein
MKRANLIAASLLVVLCGSVATARNGFYVRPYYNNRAATVGESWARGMSDVIRAQGAANLRNSQAAINLEEARSRYLDNRLKYTETFFENRRLNREFRAAERGPRVTQEQIERIARGRAPRRATDADVDPITGGLAWPRVLTQERYAPYTEKLELLFAERARMEGAIGMSMFRDIESTTSDLLATLRDNIRDYGTTDYMEARRFVERLANEARFPTQ